MKNPAFIVEGDQEQKIVQKLCPGRKVVKLGVNGKTVTYAKIASVIRDKIKLFGNRHYPIIVLFDRESRADSSEMIIRNVCSELEKHVKKELVAEIIFGVPDRKIEAWILPFVDNSGNFLHIPSGDYEGQYCLGELERRFIEQPIGYSKTTQGVAYFSQINPDELAQISHSFRLFYERVKTIPCRWIQKI